MRLTEEQVRKDIDTIAGANDNASKLAWRRKRKKMEELIEELKPYEEKILQIYKERLPILDKIESIRSVMIQECIHPKDQLVHKGTHVECKFCGKTIKPKR